MLGNMKNILVFLIIFLLISSIYLYVQRDNYEISVQLKRIENKVNELKSDEKKESHHDIKRIDSLKEENKPCECPKVENKGNLLTLQECQKIMKEKNISSQYSHPDWRFWHNKAIEEKLIENSNLEKTDLIEVFQRVYEGGIWGGGSGDGSSMEWAEEYICFINSAIDMLNITVFLDIPCGDQQWAPYLRSLRPDLKYIGVDIVPALIQRAMSEFKDAEFFLMDLSEPNAYEKLFKKSIKWKREDKVMIHSRHTFQHNSYSTLRKIMGNIRAIKNSKEINPDNVYVGVSNWIFTTSNSDTNDGGFSPFNLHLEPFNLPVPLVMVKDVPYNHKVANRDRITTSVWHLENF